MRNTLVLLCCGAILSGCAQRAGTLVPAQRSPASESVTSAKSYKVIYDFDQDQGRYPNSLIDVGGTLYGTSAGGGRNDVGTVFSVTAAGKERVIYSFKGGDDGDEPSSRLTNVNGTLYGVTSSGGGKGCAGSFGCGTVFKVTTTGKESVLYRFTGPPGDGAGPSTALLAVGDTLYGTTYSGGASNSGTIYTLKTTGGKEELYDFTGGDDGANPDGGLTQLGGVLYGTTLHGGTRGDGTVFTVTASGKEVVLHNFTGAVDGQGPVTDLLDVKGTLYGTTIYGGNSYYGTVFTITPSGTETPVFNFAGYAAGGYPEGSLVDVNGALYGVTQEGGVDTNDGVVYKLTTVGKLTFLHSFKGPPKDGEDPGLLLTSLGGKLYGTTFTGGKFDNGTIYEVAP